MEILTGNMIEIGVVICLLLSLPFLILSSFLDAVWEAFIRVATEEAEEFARKEAAEKLRGRIR